MNCQQCGVQNASFHYQVNINGQMHEIDLCADCAAELQGAVRSGGAGRFGGLSDLFSGSLFGGSLLEQAFLGNRPGMNQGRGSAFAHTASHVVPEPGEAKIPLEADVSLKERRHLNALRAELGSVIAAENFERAAELRDEIHQLEQTQ